MSRIRPGSIDPEDNVPDDGPECADDCASWDGEECDCRVEQEDPRI